VDEKFDHNNVLIFTIHLQLDSWILDEEIGEERGKSGKKTRRGGKRR